MIERSSFINKQKYESFIKNQAKYLKFSKEYINKNNLFLKIKLFVLTKINIMYLDFMDVDMFEENSIQK